MLSASASPLRLDGCGSLTSFCAAKPHRLQTSCVRRVFALFWFSHFLLQLDGKSSFLSQAADLYNLCAPIPPAPVHLSVNTPLLLPSPQPDSVSPTAYSVEHTTLPLPSRLSAFRNERVLAYEMANHSFVRSLWRQWGPSCVMLAFVRLLVEANSLVPAALLRLLVDNLNDVDHSPRLSCVLATTMILSIALGTAMKVHCDLQLRKISLQIKNGFIGRADECRARSKGLSNPGELDWLTYKLSSC